MNVVLILVFAWGNLTTANARVFNTEQQYVKQYGPNLNKGVPVAPPYKFAIYRYKTFTTVALFVNQVSEGELTIKNVANGRLSDRDVIGILATNQGGSIWKKEKVETATDPNTPQVSLYTRKDGKLFAAYIWSIPVPCLIIGTKRGGEFLLKQQNDLTRYIKI